MATSQIASMLDELMGRNRNVAANENVRELQWSDPEVCKYFVVQFCPHDLFTNTKADLGPCGKIHDEDMKRKFHDEKESYKKSQYLDEFLRFCQRMLTELQTRIKKAKERLYLTQNEDAIPTTGGQNKEAEDKLRLLSQRITSLVEEAEAAGCEGNVEQAQGLMKLSDQLREERDTLRRSIMPFLKDEYAQQQKAMEVCDTCGAFLIVGDAQQRIDDHLMGKQHIGYARLRSAVDEIVEERRKWRDERDKEMEERRKRRAAEDEESRAKRRKERRGGSGDRDTKVSRDHRERRRRSRSRSKDRSSKDRSSKDRSSKDRSTRRRSRSRDRDRRRRKSRSRSRDRRKPSRDDRDRKRERSRERSKRREAEEERRSSTSNKSRSKEPETTNGTTKDRH